MSVAHLKKVCLDIVNFPNHVVDPKTETEEPLATSPPRAGFARVNLSNLAPRERTSVPEKNSELPARGKLNLMSSSKSNNRLSAPRQNSALTQSPNVDTNSPRQNPGPSVNAEPTSSPPPPAARPKTPAPMLALPLTRSATVGEIGAANIFTKPTAAVCSVPQYQFIVLLLEQNEKNKCVFHLAYLI